MKPTPSPPSLLLPSPRTNAASCRPYLSDAGHPRCTPCNRARRAFSRASSPFAPSCGTSRRSSWELRLQTRQHILPYFFALLFNNRVHTITVIMQSIVPHLGEVRVRNGHPPAGNVLYGGVYNGNLCSFRRTFGTYHRLELICEGSDNTGSQTAGTFLDVFALADAVVFYAKYPPRFARIIGHDNGTLLSAWEGMFDCVYHKLGRKKSHGDRRLGFHRLRFQKENAGDELQAIRNAVPHFLEQKVFLREQVLPLRFERTLVGDIEQGEQDFSPVVFIPYLTRVYEQRAHAHRGKMVLYLVPFDGRILRNHLFEKGAQRGNAPLAVVEVVKKFALRIFVRQSEFFIERAACGDDAQLLIQNNQWLPDGVDDGSPARGPLLPG